VLGSFDALFFFTLWLFFPPFIVTEVRLIFVTFHNEMLLIKPLFENSNKINPLPLRYPALAFSALVIRDFTLPLRDIFFDTFPTLSMPSF